MSGTLAASARAIAPLAWPVFVGQLSVVAFATVDTVLVARHSAADLAVLAVGSAAYMTTFITLMGLVLAVGPITGQLFGAKRFEECGVQLGQAAWLALGAALPGCTLLLFPAPFIAIAGQSAELAERTRLYLSLLALALPAALLFTAYRGFNVAVSRPKAVMALQLGALALKVPLSMLLIHGQRELRLPALGVAGAALATVIVMWLQLAAAWLALRRDRFYRRFALRGLGRPERKPLAALLRLGVPMGLSILVEVSGFTMMAIFIARLGTTPVAAHQLVANLASVLFMMPLALANATGTLVAQNVGAGDLAAARRIGWHGIAIACAVALAMSSAVFAAREPILRLYTNDAVVIGAALPLLAWFVVFHVADAAQAVAAFVLRAWRIAVVPMLIYAAAAWLLGLGGGTLLGFDVLGNTPRELTGAAGYWFAASAGMVAAALALAGFLQFVMRTKVR